MKLLWLSVAPWAPTGYGVVTSEIVPRLQQVGHEVTIATKHFHTGTVPWNGCEVISGVDITLLNRMVENEGFDYVISLLDIHTLTEAPLNWIAYCPIDTQRMPLSVLKRLDAVKIILAMSKHGQAAFAEQGYEATYVPHGVDTETYFPDEKYRQQAREKLEWADNFIVGSVGVNYHDDRKNFVNLIKAFAELYKRHPDVRLWMGTNLVDDQEAYPLPLIIKDLGLREVMRWAQPDAYYLGKVTPQIMANRYRALDVFCLPTRGEGFGLPLIEAQSCGVPIITTGASTGPELTKGGWLIPVGQFDWEWFNKTWRPFVGAQAILDALEKAYAYWKKGKLRDEGMKGCEFIQENYNWDYVFNTYWKPVLRKLENFPLEIQDTPNYGVLYKSFDGRFALHDCGEWCKTKPCGETYPLLPNEPETERPILSRSYPVRPASNGELMVDTTCPLHRWLSRKFIQEAKRTWKELWGYPEIRRALQDEMPKSYIPLDDIKIDFDSEYKWALQSQYYTICPDLTPYIKDSDTVLDVGCGDGDRVKELRKRGVDAIGVEINQACVDGDAVVEGDAENLVFDDESFDVVLSVDVLEHLDNPTKALSEMFRVSKNKVIAILTPTESDDFEIDPTHKVEWDIERWKREINEFGEITDILSPFGLVISKRR